MLTRQREFMQWIVGGLSTSAVIVGAIWTSDNRALIVAEFEGKQSTTSASVAVPSKGEILNQHFSEKGPQDKGSGSLQVMLTSPGGRLSDGSLVLDAKTTAATDLEGLKYEWVLPEGATLISGTLSGDIGSLTEGAANTQEVTLSVSAQANAIVHFHAYRVSAGEKLGHVAHYHTLEQNSINLALAVKRQSLESESARKPASVSGENRRME